jgi:hypothetical protein
VQCVGDADCGGVAGKPVCLVAANTCVQCTAANAAACTGATKVCDTTGDAQANTCVQCNGNADCATGACDAHACDAGNFVSPPGNGPMVTAPACTGNLVAVANAACAAAYPGSHWCTVNDINGTGTYHSSACAANFYQFDGGVTCSGTQWSVDEASGCTNGVLAYAVQPYVMAGSQHEIDCCD